MLDELAPVQGLEFGSQKVQCEGENLVFSHLRNFLTSGLQTKNYAAIDRAASARSKSDELFVCNRVKS